MRYAAAIFLLATAVQAQVVRYSGERAVRVSIRNLSDYRTALALTDDIWSHRVGIGGTIDMRVTPAQFAALAVSRVPYSILINDIQVAIDAEKAAMKRLPGGAGGGGGGGGVVEVGGGVDGPGWFDTYHDYTDVRGFARGLALSNPNLASFSDIGQSVEARNIFALRVTGPGGGGGPGNRPQILITGGQHAREWISVATVMYLANELVSRYNSDASIRALMDNIEFLFVPIVNPDGYVYTWTTERLWRKNRRDLGAGTGICIGVDTNRNWGFQWGGQGAASTACNETYRGASAFSEPETQVIRDFSLASTRLVAAIDYHSYSQLVMSPWGYTQTLPPQPDAGFFDQLTTSIRDGIRESGGAIYTPGPIFSTIYPASGTAVDWWYGGRGIYGLTVELRDTGAQGFTLSPDQIIPTGAESLAGLENMAEFFMPVRFSLPSAVPVPLTPNTPTPFEVSISPGPGWTLDAASPKLYSRHGASGPFTSSALVPISGDRFLATLPPAPCGTPVQYYFEAAAVNGPTLTYPSGASPLQATPYQTNLVFSDDMELDRGWTVVNAPALTAGAWERADPVATFNLNNDMANPEDDATPAPGVLCFATENGAHGAAAGLSDVDGGPTTLISPPINIAGAASALVTYNRWVYSANGQADPLVVEVSPDGQTWTQVDRVTTTSGWKQASFILPPGFAVTSTFRVRFSIADVPNDSLTEAAIDDVRVFSLACPCYPNCDASTGTPLLTANDFQCFLNAFAAGSPYANCDAVGGLTANDFQCFLNSFATGCP